MSPSTPEPTAPILPTELLNEIFSHIVSNGDFPTLRALALVSHHAKEWTDQKLRRHICVYFPELYRFLQVERPQLESLEICPPQPLRQYSPESLRPLEEDVLLIPRNWPNITRFCVRDEIRHIETSCTFTFTEGLTRLPNLTTIYMDHSYQMIDLIQPPLAFPCLTHLYLPASPLPDDEENLTPVSPDCFPSLTHVAFIADYDAPDGWGVHLDFDEAKCISAEWLALPSICRLIFRWEPEPSDEFTEELQEFMHENELDDRVVFISLDDYEYGPFQGISCFDFMDRLWRIGDKVQGNWQSWGSIGTRSIT